MNIHRNMNQNKPPTADAMKRESSTCLDNTGFAPLPPPPPAPLQRQRLVQLAALRSLRMARVSRPADFPLKHNGKDTLTNV